MSADPSFPARVVPPAIRPHLSDGIDVPLSFLSANEVDVRVVIGGVQKALQSAINSAADDTSISLAILRAVVADIPGVFRCRYVYSDGDDVDLAASDAGYLVDTPSQIDAGDCRIIQA